MSEKISPRKKLIKRLRYLWTWELFDSLFLPAIIVLYARYFQEPIGFLAIYSMSLTAWVLWQGAAYWWLTLQALKTNAAIKPAYLRWFARLKKINWILIGVLPILLTGKGLLNTFFRSRLDLIAGLGLYTLAVLEQINYYYYQLMYDQPSDWRYLSKHKKLKKSSLNRALQSVNKTDD
jgi:hypothetical protein